MKPGPPKHVKVFDSHFHVIDPRFPLTPNDGFIPEPFTCADYLARMEGKELVGGAVVSGSFQAFDQTYLLHALQTLGPNFVGVTQLPESTSDQELERLSAGGVRALRFNLKRGGSESVRCLESMARRVHDVAGWRVELYVDSAELEELYPVLVSLPAVSIDHLGLSRAGFDFLVRLAERGVKIKATGFGRVDFDVKQALRLLHDANPNALLFGTDLPSTRAGRPFAEKDYSLVTEALGEDAAKAVFHENARRWYGIED